MNDRRHASLSAIGIVTLFCVGFTAMASAEGNSSQNDPGQLGVQWWQQVLSIPGVQNPFLDETGASCGIGQRGNTWMLYSSSTGPLVDLKCTIPAGKPIFLAVSVVICIPSLGETIEHNVQLCKDITDSTNFMRLKIDGKFRNDLIKRRAFSRAFTLAVPDDNVFGFPTGFFDSVHDGYYALIPPLKPGVHWVRVKATDTTGFATDTRYRLEIVESAKTLPF